MKFQIWSEGYRASGDSGPAIFYGEWEGDTFVDACIDFQVRGSSKPELFNFETRGKYIKETIVTYWGCRLFDNEADARQSFG